MNHEYIPPLYEKQDAARRYAEYRSKRILINFWEETLDVSYNEWMVEEAYYAYLEQNNISYPDERLSEIKEKYKELEHQIGSVTPYHSAYPDTLYERVSSARLQDVSEMLIEELIRVSETLDRCLLLPYTEDDLLYIRILLEERLEELETAEPAAKPTLIRKFRAGIAWMQDIMGARPRFPYSTPSRTNESTHVSAPLAEDSTPSDHMLSLRQVALLYIYLNKSLARSSASKIALKYGHTSGERLYRKYSEFLHPLSRLNIDGRKIKPLIADIEAVLALLQGEAETQAQSDLQKLRDKKS